MKGVIVQHFSTNLPPFIYDRALPIVDPFFVRQTGFRARKERATGPSAADTRSIPLKDG